MCSSDCGDKFHLAVGNKNDQRQVCSSVNPCAELADSELLWRVASTVSLVMIQFIVIFFGNTILNSRLFSRCQSELFL